jgi:hypothetical protein
MRRKERQAVYKAGRFCDLGGVSIRGHGQVGRMNLVTMAEWTQENRAAQSSFSSVKGAYALIGVAAVSGQQDWGRDWRAGPTFVRCFLVGRPI